MQELPVLNVTQGAPINDEFTLRSQDLTGWTGVAKFTRRYQPTGRAWDYGATVEASRVIVTADVALTVTDGNTKVAIDVADTADFPALQRIGDFVTAYAEYRLTSPTGAVLVYQRPVAVAGAL